MILLVTPNLRAEDCVAALSEATGEKIALAESLRRATTLLREESHLCVILDQYLLEAEPAETETLMQHLGDAIPVQVNLAICGLDRLVREVRAAVQRRKREEVSARRAAEKSLHSELNSTVTALLLTCELALGTPDLPPPVLEKLRSAHDLVEKLRSQLQPTP
jgi:hypothetical protein